MLRIVSGILVAIFIVTPAAAHSLRVFAKVEGRTVAGYGFFVGGGRPQGAMWTATMDDATLFAGRTDEAGGFAFQVPGRVTHDVVVVIDTGEGHVASVRLAPARFGAIGAPAAPSGSAALEAAAPEASAGALRQPPSPDVAALVDAAVARQVAPLLERLEAMDARMRFTDIVSGLFLILGLAGAGLWALGGRR